MTESARIRKLADQVDKASFFSRMDFECGLNFYQHNTRIVPAYVNLADGLIRIGAHNDWRCRF